MAFQILDRNGNPVSNCFIPRTSQNVATGTQSSVFTNGAFLRLNAEADLHYKVGTNPSASTSDVRLFAKQGEEIYVPPGERLGVLGGTLNVTELKGE